MSHCPRCNTLLEQVDDCVAELVVCPVCNWREVIDFQQKGIRLTMLSETEAGNAGERPVQG